MRLKRPLIKIVSLFAVFGVGCVARQPDEPSPEQPATPDEVFVSVQQPEPGLQLRAELKSRTIQAGGDHWVSVTLINTSETVTHRVVKPGHGSEIGSREPHTYWTATIDRGDGRWVPVTEERRYGYCGTCLAFASYWPKDAVRFKPGDNLELHIPQQFEFQQAGRVRLQAHYEYRASGRFPPEDLGIMAGVPPFKLSSNPVEFDVVRPLDVRVWVKGPLKVKQKTRLSDLLGVSLVNRSEKGIECSSPTLHADARLGLVTERGGWGPSLTEERTAYGVTKTLEPGEEVPLLGPGEFPNGVDGTWEYPEKGVVRVRAVYVPTTWNHGPTIMSEWVEVRVEE